MRRTLIILLLGTSALAVAGCKSGFDYSPPALPPQGAAIITGSKLQSPDFNALLVAVDGKLTGPHRWDEGIVVGPDTHVVKFMVGKHTLFAEAGGVGEVQLTAEAGKTYVIRATEPAQVTGICATSSGWVERDDSTVISERVPVIIRSYTGGVVPLAGGGFVTIPSHTTCPPT